MTAYKDMLGISPDNEVNFNRCLLREVDGPMLKHGLQEMRGRTLMLPAKPADQPACENLDFRFQQFVGS